MLEIPLSSCMYEKNPYAWIVFIETEPKLCFIVLPASIAVPGMYVAFPIHTICNDWDTAINTPICLFQYCIGVCITKQKQY